MRALSNLIALNEPDLVLFVGEALVGNDAVDQLVKFNRSLADLAPNAAMSKCLLRVALGQWGAGMGGRCEDPPVQQLGVLLMPQQYVVISWSDSVGAWQTRLVDPAPYIAMSECSGGVWGWKIRQGLRLCTC
jgi:hypothetical protein